MIHSICTTPDRPGQDPADDPRDERSWDRLNPNGPTVAGVSA